MIMAVDSLPCETTFWRRLAVCFLLLSHAGLLAYSASCHSPTHLEPAILASGIANWEFGRFELYRVNPPLVRMIAALPALIVGAETDWSRYSEQTGSRSEFAVGEDFVAANGLRAVSLVFYARLACVPISALGAYFAFRWANDLYGPIPALLTLFLYSFDPNLLAIGELITSDAACSSLGVVAGYSFWRWLRQPSWSRAGLAGGALGLSLLSKFNWIILVGVWPLLWVFWILSEKHSRPCAANNQFSTPGRSRLRQLMQLVLSLVMAGYVVNFGYGFSQVGMPLKNLAFASSLFGGAGHDHAGNHFSNSIIGELPLPLPAQYLLGIDAQVLDLESYPLDSYLRGEWRHGGWWYYYLYGLLVKVPCGTLGIGLIVIIAKLCCRQRVDRLRDEVILLTPAILNLCLVSSQTGFNHHLRYVYPSLALSFVAMGQAWIPTQSSTPVIGDLGRSMFFPCSFRFRRCLPATAALLLGYSVVSTACTYPHHLCYFNDLVGGPQNGSKHLLGSNVDFGQNSLLLKQWLIAEQPRRVILIQPRMNLAEHYGVPNDASSLSGGRIRLSTLHSHTLCISATCLRGGCGFLESREGKVLALDAKEIQALANTTPVTVLGYSTYIYRL